MSSKKICITALGIALYVCVSMILKIPMIAHISLDLGYIILAVYCYHFGAFSGAVVGGGGAVLVSLLASGWFPPGWLIGNILIGIICGLSYERDKTIKNMVISILMVIIGIFGMKTVVECVMYDISFEIKMVSNGIAALTDAIVMCIGVLIAQKLPVKSDMVSIHDL